MEIKRLAFDAALDDVLKRILVRGLPRQLVTAITGSLREKFATVSTAANKALTVAAVLTSSAATVATVLAPQTSSSRRGGCGGCAGHQRGARTGPRMMTVTLCSYRKNLATQPRNAPRVVAAGTRIGSVTRRKLTCSVWKSPWMGKILMSANRKTNKSVAERGRITYTSPREAKLIGF